MEKKWCIVMFLAGVMISLVPEIILILQGVHPAEVSGEAVGIFLIFNYSIFCISLVVLALLSLRHGSLINFGANILVVLLFFGVTGDFSSFPYIFPNTGILSWGISKLPPEMRMIMCRFAVWLFEVVIYTAFLRANRKLRDKFCCMT